MRDASKREAAWSALVAHAARIAPQSSTRLIAQPGRLARLSRRLGPLRIDLARQRLDLQALSALQELALACGHGAAVAALLRGDPVNPTEQRPALHTVPPVHLAASGFLVAVRSIVTSRPRVTSTTEHPLATTPQSARRATAAKP